MRFLNSRSFVLFLAAALAAQLRVGLAQTNLQNDRVEVREQEIHDLKSVYATVRSKDLTEARVRTPGTVVSLKVDEGAQVRSGQVLAVVADPKIALRIESLDAQILGLQSRVATAKLDFERAEILRRRGVTPQSRVDQLKTALDVAENALKSTRSQRLVAEQEATEGQVLAPADGRVLNVPVTTGSVVLAGESIAKIAANDFLLRLTLPERHARFLKSGDLIRVGARGLSPEGIVRQGRITQVYPELQSGRVIADAEAPGLGDFYVGERTLVWIAAGRRRAITIPTSFSFRRFGLDHVHLLHKDGRTTEIIVQLGQQRVLSTGVRVREVLAGLRPGDVISKAASKP
mgnify:FL=1